MKRWVLALSVGLLMSIVSVVLRQQHLLDADPYTRYYSDAFCLAAFLFSLFSLVQLVYRLRVPERGPALPIGLDPTNKREAYRITYPPERSPRLHVRHPRHPMPHEDVFAVCNLSEGGLCFVNPDNLSFDRAIQGEVAFADGHRAAVTGTVIRAEDGRVSIKLLTPLDSDLVMGEQRRLIADEREDG